MPKQQESSFKTTQPASGQVRFLSNTSGEVQGITISINDCGGNSRVESISNLTSLEINSVTLTTVNGESYGNYYYYDVSPTVSTASLVAVEGICTTSTLAPAPIVDTFRNSQYNATFNNAILLRRRQMTGSVGSNTSGIFEVERKNSTLIPENFESILSGSAVTASFQESNLYSKTWVLPRYEGSKLDSGSLYLNDPALTFKAFSAAKFSLLASSSVIRSSSLNDLELETFYYNSPYLVSASGRNLTAYHQGSIQEKPPVNQPVYELSNKDFKRVTKSKLYIPDLEEIIRISEDKAAYEIKPVDIPSSSTAENIFLLEFQTLASHGDTIYYWTSDRDALNPSQSLKEYFIRPGNTEELFVSGTYLSDLALFDTDAPASDGERVSGIYTPNLQPWQSTLGREKTYVSRIISRSIDAS